MEKTEDLIQAHGKTIGEMRQIALKQSGQIPGGLKKFTPNNVQNLKDKHFIEDGLQNHMVDEHETGIYHVAQETRSFNPISGEKLSKGFVQKYDVQTFKFMRDNRGFEGQSIFVLHDPTLEVKEEAPINDSGSQDLGLRDTPEFMELAEMCEDLDIEIEENDNVISLNKKIAKAMTSHLSEFRKRSQDLEVREQQLKEQQENATDKTDLKEEPKEVLLSQFVQITDDMTVAELQSIADAHKIELGSRDSKAIILQKLREAKIKVHNT